MIVVIFEVQFNIGRDVDYFKMAKNLSSSLEQTDGFISSDRFESITTPGKFISVSFLSDTDAVKE